MRFALSFCSAARHDANSSLNEPCPLINPHINTAARHEVRLVPSSHIQLSLYATTACDAKLHHLPFTRAEINRLRAVGCAERSLASQFSFPPKTLQKRSPSSEAKRCQRHNRCMVFGVYGYMQLKSFSLRLWYRLVLAFNCWEIQLEVRVEGWQ
jgi:hypothetical protein